MPVSRRSADVTVCAVLTVAFLAIVGPRIGIDPYDETNYLHSQVWMGAHDFLTNQSWAPLYAKWYWVIAHLQPNPMKQYFESWGLLVLFLALLPAVWRIARARVYAVFLLALPILITPPYVSLFAACILLPGMCFCLGAPRRFSPVLLIATCATFAASFVRPELQYSVYAASAACVLACLLERASHSRVFTAATILIVCCLALTIHHIAVLSAPANRSAVAFVDAVNLRANDRGLLPPGIDGWSSDYAQRTFGLDVGHAGAQVTASISQYFHASPRQFFLHILWNLIDVRTVVLLVLFALAVAWPWVARDREHFRPASIYMAVIAVGSLAGILVIYPREHYAMVFWPSLLVYSLQLIKPWPERKPSPAWIVSFACLLVGAVTFSCWRLRRAPFDYQRVQVARLRCLRRIDVFIPDNRFPVLDQARGLSPYAPHFRDAAHPEPFADWAAFESTVETVHPVWVSADRKSAHMLGTDLEQLQTFFATDERYTRFACPSDAGGMVVYVEPATP